MFRFEFDERVEVNSISVECKTIQRAIAVVTLMVGEEYIDKYLTFIHKID